MSQATQLIAEQMRNGSLVAKQFGEAFYIVTAYNIFPDGTDVTAKLQSLVNLSKTEGRSAIFFPNGQYFVTELNNTEGIYFFGDNASFIGGYTVEITQIGSSVPVKEGHASILYKRAIDEIANIPSQCLIQAKAAVRNGEIKIVYWGDSITEGADQTNPNDAYANRLDNDIRRTLKGVNVQSQNFSLGGRGLYQAINSNYKGIPGPEPYPPDPAGFYRPWSVVGKSWFDHVKDYAPDLVILAFGMNDTGGTAPADGEANNLLYLINEMNNWNPVPSIVLVPTILPTKNTDIYQQGQNVTNSVARATREVAKNNGYMVADANRLFQILRDGIEEVTRSSAIEYNFQGFEDDLLWTGDKDSFQLNGVVLSPVNNQVYKYITREKTFFNGTLQVDIKPINATDTAWINYRKDDVYGYMTIFVQPQEGKISLYKGDNGDLLAQATSLTIPNGQYSNIKLIANGSSHKIYLNDQKIIDAITYKNLHDGKLSIGSSQTSVVYSNMIISFEDRIETVPAYTEEELLGKYNSSESGNGINHPSGEGHALVYSPTFNGLLRTLSNPVEYGNFIPSRLKPADWLVPVSPFPTTTTAGEKIYYQVVSSYNKARGIALRRLDNGIYYTLSAAAYSQATLANLEPNHFTFYTINSTQSLIFISVPSAGAITFDSDLYRYDM